ncbi:MAG: LLM class flavin-dependent oxidoreductase [Actinomycetota bacterium]
MRVGLALPHYDFSLPGSTRVTFERVAEQAVRAEALGFDGVWVSDHFFASLGRYGATDGTRYGSLEPITTLAALAAVTERVRLGTLVLSTAFRHPAVLAKSATAIDALSGGRLDLGLGAGWFEDEYRAFGYPFGSVGERFDLLEETLAYLGALFGQEPASFRGERFALHEAFNRPPPVQRPRPPILLGGKGGARMLRLAARYADGWNTVWRWTPDAYAVAARAAAAACEAQGRDPATFRLSLGLFTIVGRDDADVARRYELMAERLPPGVGHATDLATLRADGLAGTPGQVVERVAAFAALGVTELIVSPAPIWFAMPDPSMLDLLAEDVLPAVRAL